MPIEAVETDLPPDEQEIEDKLAAKFMAAEESPSEEPDEGESDDGDESAAKATAKPAPEGDDDDAEEVEFDGEAFKVPKKIAPVLKAASEMQADYTRKTMHVAEIRKQVEDRSHFLAAREQVLSTTVQEFAELRAAEKQLKAFEGVNWVDLANQDPGRAFALSQQRQELERFVGNQQAKIRGIVAQAEQATSVHVAHQWQSAVKIVKDKLGVVSKEDDAAALQLWNDLGLDKEVRFADARVLELAIDAARWRKLQAAKPSIAKRAADAKPVKQVTRSGPSAQRESVASQHRLALRKTGKDTHAEAYLTHLFSRKN